MTDSTGRRIHYLRVSLTDRCNLRCRYCMPAEGVTQLPHDDILRLEETLRLCRVFAALGVDRIKVTGGEPLVRRGALEFLEALRALPGIEQTTLTTNGLLLARRIDRLRAIGLDGINISLDTLDRAAFARVTGFDELDGVLEGLDAAVDSGIPVKVNCVPIEGLNGDGLCALAELARERVNAVRFIELMPVGLGSCFTGLNAAQVTERLEAAFGPLEPCAERLGNGPADYCRVEGFQGKIGFIHAVSRHFCAQCNRVRLTADGQLKLCLAHEDGVDLRALLRGGASDEQIADAIRQALAHKPDMHAFAAAQAPVGARGMNAIGG